MLLILSGGGCLCRLSSPALSAAACAWSSCSVAGEKTTRFLLGLIRFAPSGPLSGCVLVNG